MGRTVEQQTKNTAVLAIGGRFNGYGPESERAVEKADVKNDPIFARLMEAWKASDWRSAVKSHMYEEDYHDALLGLNILQSLSYTPIDVERFCLSLADLQDDEAFQYKSGLFLSALVMLGAANHFDIRTHHLAKLPKHIGWRNDGKSIRIIGDAELPGDEMYSGLIIVEGSVSEEWEKGPYLGGGTLIIKGDADCNPGGGMTGGIIIIEGNAKSAGCIGPDGEEMEGGVVIVRKDVTEEVGEGMKGGEIHVYGDIGSVGDVVQGKIYHRGKLIVNK
jgi:hypothetical protein